MNINITVNIREVHVHVSSPMACTPPPAEEVKSSAPEIVECAEACHAGLEIETAVPVPPPETGIDTIGDTVPVEGDIGCASHSEAPSPIEETVPMPSAQEDSPEPRKRGRPRKSPEQRAAEKAQEEAEREARLEVDADMMRQASEILSEFQGESDGGEAASPFPVAPVVPPTPFAGVASVNALPAPPADDRAVKSIVSGLTGEFVCPVAPDSPELDELRQTLRANGYDTVPEMLRFLSSLVGRTLLRIGELGLGEIQGVMAELSINEDKVA